MRVGPTKWSPFAFAALLVACLGWAPTRAQQPNSPSQALYDLLVTGSFAETELPRGFARPIVVPIAVDEFDDEAIGGVEVALAIPDLAGVAISTHRIVYLVYADAGAAERAFQVAQARSERLGGQSSTLGGFDYPAALLNTAGSVLSSPGVGSVCLVFAGAVLVAGISVLEQHSTRQADLNAADLAQAGVAHLDRLIAEAAASSGPSTPAG